MPQLTLSLLGSFDVRLDGVPVTGFRSDKARALLAYLVVEADRSHTRAKLAGLLWPDYSDSAALTYLRHALSNLRKILASGAEKPPFLRVENDAIQFLAHETCWSDFTYLTSALHATASDQPWQERLQQGLTYYRGPLLDGFTLVDSDRFEEWLLLRRERLQREVVEAWTQLANYHLAQQAVAQAISALQRIVELEPTAEETHRHLMQLFAGSGKRREALAQFERCRQILADELGVNPAAETLALYQQISQPTLPLNRIPTASPPRFAPLPAFFATPQTQAAKTSVLVARDMELARLDHWLAQAQQGQGALVFITGEAGQGKTALAAAFAQRAQVRLPDLLVACGNCNAQAGSGDPYLPFCEILELLTGAVESRLLAGALTRDHALRLWRAAPLALQALCEVAPDLIDSLLTAAPLVQRADDMAGQAPALPTQLAAILQHKSAATAIPQPRQEQLLRQVATLLQQVAQQHPLLLLIDDLQWADNGSIQLLFHLARQLAGYRIVLVGMFRANEVHLGRNGERHPLEPVLNELKRTFGEIEIDLNQSEGRAFVDSLLDREPNRLDAAFRALLYHQTAGHPLFTIELLRGMQERGDLHRDSDGHWVTGERLAWERLPARVEAVIAERMGRLSTPLQRLLQVASVEGEFFTAEVVARVLGSSEAETVRQLSELADRRHQLVRARGIQRLATERISRYQFGHVLFQRYLYQQLDVVDRGILHEQIGVKLAVLYRAQPETVAGELARHFEEAGMIEQAITYLRMAGERAARLLANQEAIGHLRHALTLLVHLPENNERKQLELALRLILGPAVLVVYGYWSPHVLAVYETAEKLYREVGLSAQYTQVLWGLFAYHNTNNRQRQALHYAQLLFQVADTAQDANLLCLAHRNLGLPLFHLGQPQEARFHLEQAIALYNPAHHKNHIYLYGHDQGVTAYALLAFALWMLGYPEQALQRLNEGIVIGQKNGHPFSLAYVENFAVLVCQYCKDLPLLWHYSEPLLATANKQGFQWISAQTMIYQGWALTQQGDIARGLTQLQAALEFHRSLGSRWIKGYFLSLLADGYRMAGAAEQGLQVIAETFTDEIRRDDRHWDAELYRLRGELLLLKSQEQIDAAYEAEANFQQALAIARQQGAKSLELRAATSLARLWQGQGKIEDAYHLLAPVYGWFTEGFDTRDLQEAKALLDELRRLCYTPPG